MKVKFEVDTYHYASPETIGRWLAIGKWKENHLTGMHERGEIYDWENVN